LEGGYGLKMEEDEENRWAQATLSAA